MSNIYPTFSGFGLRVNYARSAFKKFALEFDKRPNSRSFDNCFENGDGDAVVWQLMHDVINGDDLLETGIRRMGGTMFADWMNVYDPARDEHSQAYFDFLTDEQYRKS